MSELLTANKTPLEQNLTAAIKRASDLNAPIADLFNPESCPEAFLGHLAWALSVDEWDDHWPVETKRQVCKTAVEVHRHKGTVYAVKTALESVFTDVVLDDQPEALAPFEFQANVTIKGTDSAIYDAQLFSTATKLVAHAKNARSHFKGFDIAMPDGSLNLNKTDAVAMNLNLSNDLTLQATTNTNVTGYAVWTL